MIKLRPPGRPPRVTCIALVASVALDVRSVAARLDRSAQRTRGPLIGPARIAETANTAVLGLN